MADEGAAFTGNLSRLSQVRVNTKTFTIADSTTILALLRKGGQPFIPTTTGGGLFKNKPVFCDVDDINNFINFGMSEHDHTDDTPEAGGLFHNIPRRNIGSYFVYDGMSYATGDFYVDKSTNASLSTDFGGGSGKLKLDTGTDDEAFLNIQKLSVPMSFGYDSSFETRLSYNGALTNYLFRAGVGGESVGDPNDPSRLSYGIEACPADSKVLVWSCDGSTRSTLPTVYNMEGAGEVHVWLQRCLQSVPAIYTNRDLDFASGNTTEKTNNIPTTSSTPSSDIFTTGVKTTVISASKQLYYRGAKVTGMPFSSWRWFWPQYPEG